MINFTQSLQLAALSATHASDYTPNIIRCDVVFGAPRLDCNGTGICKIMNSMSNPSTLVKPDCRRSAAYASSQNGTELSLILYRENVCVNIYKNHLRKGVLDMKESCKLPKSIVRELGLASDILACGRYTVEENNGVFRIHINLQIPPANPSL